MKTILKTLILAGIILLNACSTKTPEILVLENSRVRAEFDAGNGALVRLVNKETGWNIVDRAVLGQSFEILLPLTDIDTRYNVINGNEQKAPEVEQQPNQITFTWTGLRSKNMKSRADVTFRGSVGLTDDGLEYSGELINKSKYPVEYVSWPFLGEVTVPDKQQPLYETSRTDSYELFPHFTGQHGYWGIEYPTATPYIPWHTFTMVNNKDQGWVVYRKEKFPDYLLINSFELIPGYDLRVTNPYTDEMDGQLVRIQFKANQVIYNQAGETTVLSPVRLSVYKGNQQAGMDIYKATKSPATAGSPDWIRQPLTWQKIGISSAKELVDYAREAVASGVNVLQVRGWYREAGNGLEEVDGIAGAIAECQGMGLRIVTETDWTAINANTTGYKDFFSKYIVADPWGFPYDLTLLCPLSGDVQKRVQDEWSKLASLRQADGVINIDNKSRNTPYHCFAKGHRHRPGEATANGVMALDELMTKTIRSYGEKAVMGFGFMDSQAALYDGYQITTGSQYFPGHRYLNPATPIVSTVDVRNARNDMNTAFMNRFNFSYDLKFYNNHLKDYPNIVSYGKALKSFAERYRAKIWDAEFTRTDGIMVEGNNLAWSVFVNKDGKKAIVVVNTSNGQSSQVKLQAGNTGFFYASPENQQMQSYKGYVDVNPMSIVAFFEQ